MYIRDWIRPMRASMHTPHFANHIKDHEAKDQGEAHLDDRRFYDAAGEGLISFGNMTAHVEKTNGYLKKLCRRMDDINAELDAFNEIKDKLDRLEVALSNTELKANSRAARLELFVDQKISALEAKMTQKPEDEIKEPCGVCHDQAYWFCTPCGHPFLCEKCRCEMPVGTTWSSTCLVCQKQFVALIPKRDLKEDLVDALFKN
jgi:hypothetical protein